MSASTIYTMGDDDLNDVADAVKVEVLRALVSEDLLDDQVAEGWAQTHAPVIMRKTFFRTLSNRWSEMEEAAGFFFTVVKLIA